MNLRGPLSAAWLLAAVLAGGCEAKPAQDPVQQRLDQARQELDALQRTNASLEAEVARQKQQIEDLQGLGEKRLENLFHVARIELGRYTGGVNLDDKDGDDGIRVYLQPIDQYGGTIKAAGEITVELYDLAADPKDNLIRKCHWSVEEAVKKWAGSFLSYNYTVDCPWPSSPPAHDEITVRVTFLDYLTGKQFTAQKLCKVHRAATTTAPAGK